MGEGKGVRPNRYTNLKTALDGTLALFGLANVLVWPLRTWLGPGSTWPWGVAAVLVAGTMHLGKSLRPA